MATLSSTTTLAAALFLASSDPSSSFLGANAFSEPRTLLTTGRKSVAKSRVGGARLRSSPVTPTAPSPSPSSPSFDDRRHDGASSRHHGSRRRSRLGVLMDPTDMEESQKQLKKQNQQQQLNSEFMNDLLFGGGNDDGWGAVEDATATAAAAAVAAATADAVAPPRASSQTNLSPAVEEATAAAAAAAVAAATAAAVDPTAVGTGEWTLAEGRQAEAALTPKAAAIALAGNDPVKERIEDQIETIAREGVNNVRPTRTNRHDNEKKDAPLIEQEIVTVENPSASITKAAVTTQDEIAVAAYQPPSLRTIIKFAIPAVGVWLCDPLLSLIDTAAVGLLAGTNHQAALSPAVAVVNYSALLLAFLFTGTTNFVASAAAAKAKSGSSAVATTGSNVDGDGIAKKDAGLTLLSSLQLSLYVGLALGSIIFALAPTLVRTLMGRSTPLDPAVFNPAVMYVRIRSLGFPAAAVLGSAQAACLGLKDIRSPLIVLGTAAVVNLLGDAFLVGCRSPLLYGAAGAAWATVLSQMAAVWLFLGLLKAKRPSPSSSSGGGGGGGFNVLARLKKALGKTRQGSSSDADPSDDMESTGDASWSSGPARSPLQQQAAGQQDRRPFGFVSKNVKKVTGLFHHRRSESSPSSGGAGDGGETAAADADADATDESSGEMSARGFLSDRDFRKRHILRVPSRERWRDFLPYVLPVTTTSVGRVSLFLSMAHVVSACMGVASMAAQTIVLALFDALCPLAQSLSLTAQAFVPAALEHQKSGEDGGLGRITRQFLKAGSIFGGLGVLAVGCVPLISRLFTTDPVVVAQVNAVAPHLAGIFAMHGIVMASEGCLLGRRDINFLGWMYGAFFALMPAVMMRVKQGAMATGNGAGLQSIWTIFLGYQFARMVLWALRAMRPLKNPGVARVEA